MRDGIGGIGGGGQEYDEENLLMRHWRWKAIWGGEIHWKGGRKEKTNSQERRGREEIKRGRIEREFPPPGCKEGVWREEFADDNHYLRNNDPHVPCHCEL